MKHNSNLAYQLPRRQEEINRPEIVKVPKAKPRAKTTSPLKVILFLGLIIAMSFSVMFSRAQLTEITTKVNAATKELESLESEKVRLTTELEDKVSLRNVEEYATMELGLEKLDPSQIEYVTLSDGEEVEVKEEQESSIWEKIQNFFIDVMEYIGL